MENEKDKLEKLRELDEGYARAAELGRYPRTLFFALYAISIFRLRRNIVSTLSR